MKTVAVSDETDELVEELQQNLEYTPTKKEILDKAVKEFHGSNMDVTSSDEADEEGE